MSHNARDIYSVAVAQALTQEAAQLNTIYRLNGVSSLGIVHGIIGMYKPRIIHKPILAM